MGLDVNGIVVVGAKFRFDSYESGKEVIRYDEITGEKKIKVISSKKWNLFYNDTLVKENFGKDDLDNFIEKYNYNLGNDFKDCHISYFDYHNYYSENPMTNFLFGIQISKTESHRHQTFGEDYSLEISETLVFAAQANFVRALLTLGLRDVDIKIKTYHFLNISV